MTLAYGFFNSVGSDRLYDAEDFSRYLEGIIANGCFPNDTGFKALANSEPIGANPPSIIISAGKAYYDGMWVYNDQSYVYSLGTVQQSTPGMKHLVYFCYNTNDNGREVTIECLTSANPVLPTNAAGKYYMPLALVVDQVTAQPQTSDITDQRLSAGVVATSVDTNSLLDESVTTPKIDDEAVTESKVGPKAISSGKLADHSVGLLQLAEAGIYLGSFASSYEASHSPTQGQIYEFTAGGYILDYTPTEDVTLLVFGAITGFHVGTATTGAIDYIYYMLNDSNAAVASSNHLHAGLAGTTFGGAITKAVSLTANTRYRLRSFGSTGGIERTYANIRVNGFFVALPR